MCGIVAALPAYRSQRASAAPILAGTLPVFPRRLVDPDESTAALRTLTAALDQALDAFATPGATMVLASEGIDPVTRGLARLTESVADLDATLDERTATWDADATERVQGLIRTVGDQLWALQHDRLDSAVRARRLATHGWTTRSVISYAAVNDVLDALDRLEVRGRDSAGLTIWVSLADNDRVGLTGRPDDRFRGGAVTITADGICFVYKRASIVGRLGDNTRHLREAIAADDQLHRVLALPSATVTVLAHTRWASVGRTSEDNAHPVDSTGSAGPYAIAVLNGDVDNHAALRENLAYDGEITTDAKVIPLLLSRELAGREPVLAMAATLSACAGSMAIAAQHDDAVLLAVKGSGQSLYVGFSPGGYLVASEAYGLVGVASRFARIDGAGGTVVRLTRNGAGAPAAVRRFDAAGDPLDAPAVRRAEVTTRDLALGDFEHYLQKEIHEAAPAFRKTLRGRIHDNQVTLPDSAVPPELRRRLNAGEIRHIVVVGQGTAAVAGEGIAQTMRFLVDVPVSACPATEFSAWRLTDDMSDTCVIAVSQSGSTTDTNRAVDLARERGATVLCIVNRRDSDLADKSDGVLYTSDGRDVELSVASTKAFYAQVAAGCLLGAELGGKPATSLLAGLSALPARLTALHEREDRIAEIAAQVATRHPHWTVVGSGPNRVAAAEIRIKLSELCYRTVSADAVEDKKHIDLSAEALVLVCAAGAPPHQVSDLIKEVEILAAHGNHAVVICDEDTEHLWPAEHVIPVPRAHPELAWILSTAAGHLFAYHAARAIDTAADDLRHALAAIESCVDNGEARIPAEALLPVRRVLAATESGELRGVLSSQSAVRLARLTADPAAARDVLTAALDELARPVDTVKHQAKTVTVGTSRGDADLYDNRLVGALREAGTDLGDLTFPVLHAIRAHSDTVGPPTGVTRYPPVARTSVPRLVRGRDGETVLIVPEQAGGEVVALSMVHLDDRAAPEESAA